MAVGMRDWGGQAGAGDPRLPERQGAKELRRGGKGRALPGVLCAGPGLCLESARESGEEGSLLCVWSDTRL